MKVKTIIFDLMKERHYPMSDMAKELDMKPKSLWAKFQSFNDFSAETAAVILNQLDYDLVVVSRSNPQKQYVLNTKEGRK